MCEYPHAVVTEASHTPPDAGLITPLLLDVTRPIQVTAAVRAVTAHTGPDGLAGVVNDAGTDGFGPRPAAGVAGELARGSACMT
jgi:hypothetical protein